VKKKDSKHHQDKGALEIIEEATHLLRLMPKGITALYYIGSLPFILGLLYFIADMSKSAFAYQHEAKATLAIVLLFLWMKCWQTVFCNHVKSYVSGAPAPTWSLIEIMRLCVTQTSLQPLGFIILPLAFLITLPFGYAYAFFQNISLLGDGKTGGTRALYRSALTQARLFPRQNHLVLLIIILFWFFVLLNVMIAMFMAPRLLKSFLGMETAFTLAGWGLLNTTFFAAALSISHLLVDPLIKMIYVLRCFYGESIRTGEDLTIALKLVRPAANAMVALFVFFFCWQTSVPAAAVETPIPEVKEVGLSASDLDRSLSEVIGKREYAWRLPREHKEKKKDHGLFATFVEGLIETVLDWLRTLKEWGAKVIEWLDENIFRYFRSTPPASSERGWSGSTQILLYVLATVGACLVGIFVLRTIRKRGRAAVELSSKAAPRVPDLSSEDVTANELPSGEWLALARQMAERGDLRLALRALYLGSLANLARQGIVTIAKYKSNRDYEQELRRRAAESSDLIAAFSNSIVTFESIWYGMHDISQETFRDFNENHKRIMALAEKH
jgi:hypothetical protein